jgi:aspartate aminotransferase
MPGLAARLGRAQVAATIAMNQKARAMREAGIDVLSLAIGEPDFPSPPEAIEAAHQAALRGETKYPPVDGIPALKQAIQRKFQRDSGLDYAPDEIMVANGGKQVIYNAILATVDDGDEVVIPAPYWVTYALIAQFAGGIPVFVPCPQNNGFRLRPDDLDAAITPRTKWLILNFPNNPTGAACSRAEMAAIGTVMRRHPHVWIMCDDMYEHLIYDDFDYLTMAAAAPELRERTLTISGVSKTYAMTGWRVGFAGGPKPLIRAMVNMQSQATSGVAPMNQAAAAAALDGPQEGVAARAAIYRRRRDLVVEALDAAPGMSCHRPEGAFYVYPNVAGCLDKTTAGGRRIGSDEEFARALLDEQQVAVVHGAAFGMSPYLRISYATGEDKLAEACRRIVAFCEGLH